MKLGGIRGACFGLFWLGLLGGCSSGRDDGVCQNCSTAGQINGGSSGGFSSQAGSSSSMHTGGTGAQGGGAGAQGGGAIGSGPERVVAVTLLLNLIVKDGFVYYSDAAADEQQFTNGHLSGVRVTGGTPRVYAQAPSAPSGTAATRLVSGIASDGTNLFWTEDPGGTASHVAKTSIATGDTTEVWSDATCSVRKPLTLDRTQLYWLATCVGSSGQLMTAATTGGAASVVLSGNGDAWSANPYGSNEDTRGLAVGSGFALWTHVTGAVASLALSGSAMPLTLNPIHQVDGPSAIVLSGTQAVFLEPDYQNQGKGDILSVTPNADFATEAKSMAYVAQNQLVEYETSLAVDDGFVYWGVSKSIQRAPLAGGAAVTVVSNLPNPDPRALAVDDTHVYWADDTGIWRAPKN